MEARLGVRNRRYFLTRSIQNDPRAVDRIVRLLDLVRLLGVDERETLEDDGDVVVGKRSMIAKLERLGVEAAPVHSPD